MKSQARKGDEMSTGSSTKNIKKRDKSRRKGRDKTKSKKKGIDFYSEQLAALNNEVMRNLDESGAINFLIAGMFTRLSRYANQHKNMILSSGFRPMSSPNTEQEEMTSDDKRNQLINQIAARIVFEYLVDNQLHMSYNSLQSETKKEKAFSSKTTASLEPLQLDGIDINDDSGTISKIIKANKIHPANPKPPARRRANDEEIDVNFADTKPHYISSLNTSASGITHSATPLASPNAHQKKMNFDEEVNQSSNIEQIQTLSENKETLSNNELLEVYSDENEEEDLGLNEED